MTNSPDRTAAPAPSRAHRPRLRIVHEGLLSLRLERPGRTIRFNPRHPPDDDDIVVLDWNWSEHLRATEQAVASGRRFDAVAPEPVRRWLTDLGLAAGRVHPSGAVIDGVMVEQQPYQPIPWATPIEGVRKFRSALVRPGRAVRRLASHRGLPRCEPQVTALGFADGARLLHANLSLHRGTPDDWLAALARQRGGADWLLVGCDFEEDAAVAARVPRLSAATIVVVDLVNEVRRSIGMPTGLLTPLVDRLRRDGLDAHLLAAHTSMRFEERPTMQ
ncbi:MAG: hypothetical protein D6798_12250 [Deltaproteobacteria bacterium]|nr:MAG: hypothetical protein D6798_12250 [Deltaproteobacteria bacterium]